MDLKKGFKDISIVNGDCRIEYLRISEPDFFGYRPEQLLGKKFTQFYTNIDESTSTLARAIYGEERFINYEQILENGAGKTVKQMEDIYVLRDDGEIVGAIEFADYDVRRDLISSQNISMQNVPDDEKADMDSIVGESQCIQQIKKKIPRVKNTDAPVLIMGESGTGKELLARVVHNCGDRRENPFIYVNCSALPENLLEGILFGTKKGSFTDSEEKKGLFQMASGGTLFLDEVDSMSLRIQPKLLRTIEEKSVRPIGASEEEYLDVRVIAACNKPLDQLLKTENLRNDLVFRLSVLTFLLPPLRQRGEDILLIAEYYMKKYNRIFKKEITGFSPALKKRFLRHPWTGNVRELKNLLEGVYPLLTKNVIGEEDLENHWLKTACRSGKSRTCAQRAAADFQASGQDLRSYLQTWERQTILQALADHGGDEKAAAGALHISRQLLRYKLEQMKE